MIVRFYSWAVYSVVPKIKILNQAQTDTLNHFYLYIYSLWARYVTSSIHYKLWLPTAPLTAPLWAVSHSPNSVSISEKKCHWLHFSSFECCCKGVRRGKKKSVILPQKKINLHRCSDIPPAGSLSPLHPYCFNKQQRLIRRKRLLAFATPPAPPTTSVARETACCRVTADWKPGNEKLRSGAPPRKWHTHTRRPTHSASPPDFPSLSGHMTSLLLRVICEWGVMTVSVWHTDTHTYTHSTHSTYFLPFLWLFMQFGLTLSFPLDSFFFLLLLDILQKLPFFFNMFWPVWWDGRSQLGSAMGLQCCGWTEALLYCSATRLFFSKCKKRPKLSFLHVAELMLSYSAVVEKSFWTLMHCIALCKSQSLSHQQNNVC